MVCYENMLISSPMLAFYRGDTVRVPLTFEVGGADPYVMQPGDELLFVCFRGNQALFRVKMTDADQLDDGSIQLVIASTQTENLRPDTYSYEVELLTASGEKHTAGNGTLMLIADKITPEVRADD
jgi:hypothetical protein